VMGMAWREERRVVVRLRSWVAREAKMRCQVVRRIAGAVSGEQGKMIVTGTYGILGFR